VDSLRTEFGKGLLLPPKESNSSPQDPKQPKKTSIQPQSSAPAKAMGQLSIDQNGQKKPVAAMDGRIEWSERFKCTGQELYNALTVREMLAVFTGGDVLVMTKSDESVSTAEEGATFSMLGGNIQGTYIIPLLHEKSIKDTIV